MAFDPNTPIREILRNQSMLFHVDDAQEGYVYAYEQFGGASGNTHINRAKAVGYEVVRGEMPENADNRDAQGMCVIGDTILMRIPRARAEEVYKEVRQMSHDRLGGDKNEQMLEGINEALSRELGRQVKVSFTYKDPSELQNRGRRQ